MNDPRRTGEWNDDAAAWMEGFASEHGIVAMLDHLHLGGPAQEVAALRSQVQEQTEELERLRIERDNAGFIPWRGAQDAIEEAEARAEAAEARLIELTDELERERRMHDRHHPNMRDGTGAQDGR